MTGSPFLRSPLFTLAGLVCVCPAAMAQDVVTLHGPDDMLALWQTMCRNLQEKADVRISPEWKATPKQAIGLTMQDLNADSYSCDYRPDTGIITLKPRYSSDAKLVAAAANPALVEKLSEREKQALQKAQARIAEVIRPGMSEYEKVLALHDDLVKAARFTPVREDPCTEMLLKGEGVCDGYARAFHVLLTMAGVENRYAFGEAKREKHLWNLVRVDGEWYHIDITWNDGMNGYGYFLLTDKELEADHHWDKRRFHATAQEGHLYHRRNGLYHETYDELWAALADAWENGADSYECYFTAFGDRATFLRKLGDFRTAHPEVSLQSWTGNHDGDCVLQIRFNRGK